MKQLEDELGLSLIDRGDHTGRLTDAGKIVYRRALTMLAEWDHIPAELDELRGLRRGALRLGLPAVGSSTMFAPLFAIYRDRHPDIGIQLVEGSGDQLEALVLRGEVELAASPAPVPGDFEWQRVRSELLAVLLPADHALARRSSVAMPCLKEQPFILFDAGFALNRIILDACRRCGFEPTVTARSRQIEFIVGLVAAGLGIAFLPRTIAERHSHPAVRPVPLAEPQTEWHVGLMWRRGAVLSQAAKAWLALAREMLDER